jgi:hypothetical protein
VPVATELSPNAAAAGAGDRRGTYRDRAGGDRTVTDRNRIGPGRLCVQADRGAAVARCDRPEPEGDGTCAGRAGKSAHRDRVYAWRFRIEPDGDSTYPAGFGRNAQCGRLQGGRICAGTNRRGVLFSCDRIMADCGALDAQRARSVAEGIAESA